MIGRAIGIGTLLVALAALPVLAGEECAAHASKEKAHAAALQAKAEAASPTTVACAEAVALAERTIKEIDGGVAIEFKSKDRKVLDEIVRLANEGRIFGDGTPENTVPRRVKRQGRTVTLTVSGRTAAELAQIRSVAASLGTPSPECGERLATASTSSREG